MFTLTKSHHLAIAAAFGSVFLALGASAPSEAANKSLNNCRGTMSQTYRCCKQYEPKPIWFRQQALNCENVIRCVRKRCYVQTWQWNPNFLSSGKDHNPGRGGKDLQNGPNSFNGGQDDVD
jgi:hypothetical protein